jgi:uncharacterized protein (TIGR02646 family)
MLYILKQTEPPELTALRKTPIAVDLENLQVTRKANYNDLKDDIRKKVKADLLKEQGYLCAYCMREIDDVRIEHQQPQTNFPELDLEYSNFLGVCVGFYHENENTHPDHSKPHCESVRGSTSLKINPLDAATVAQLKYTGNGRLIADDETIYKDVDKTLNLNIEVLRTRRLDALDGVKKGLNIRYKHISADIYAQQIQKYSNFKDGKRYKYCGIILYHLEKELAKLQNR